MIGIIAGIFGVLAVILWGIGNHEYAQYLMLWVIAIQLERVIDKTTRKER